VGYIHVLDREDWLIHRRCGIGGSDIAAICGFSPYSKPAEIWAQKAGKDKRQVDNAAVYWGHTLEPVVADEFARRHKDLHVMSAPGIITNAENPIFMATVDRLYWNVGSKGGSGSDPKELFENPTDNFDGILEIKTTRIGRDWDETLPKHVEAQLQWYLGVTGLQRGHVAVLIGGQDYQEFEIEVDQEMIGRMQEQAMRFWEDYVLTDTRPPMAGTNRELELMKAIYPESVPNTMTYKPEIIGFVEQFEQAKADIKDAEARKREAEIEIRNAIEDNEIALVGDYTVTAKTQKAAMRFDSGAFKADNPGLYESYRRESKAARPVRVKLNTREEDE